MMVYSYTSLNDTQVCSYSALGRREKTLHKIKGSLHLVIHVILRPYVFIMYDKQIQYITPLDLFKTCIYHQVFVNVAGLLFGGQLSSVCQILAAAMQQYVLCIVVVVQQQMQYLHSQQWMAALKGAAGIQKKSGSQPRSGRVPRRRCRSNTTVPTSSLRRRTPMYTYLYVRP